MSIVSAGSNSLTILVATMLSIACGVLLAGTVTVSMLSDVCNRVMTSGPGAAGGVATEPPSTATTEYSTRLRTARCLGGAWDFSGKAWVMGFKEKSANMTRREVRSMIEAITTAEFWEMTEGARSGNTRKSRYDCDREELQLQMQMQMQLGERRERETKNLRANIFYQSIEIEDGWLTLFVFLEWRFVKEEEVGGSSEFTWLELRCASSSPTSVVCYQIR